MKKQEIYILNKNRKIHAVFVKPDSKDNIDKFPAVLITHGMTSSNSGYIEIAEKLAGRGIAGLAISMSGHGKSSGNFNTLTVDDLVSDGIVCMDYLLSIQGVDKENVGVLGTSVGAHVASMVTSSFEVKSILLRVPAVYSDKMRVMTLTSIMDDESSVFFNLKEHLPDTVAIKSISEYEGSLLVISSEKDEIIPEYIPNTYVNQASKAKSANLHLIKNATHALSKKEWRQEFIDVTLEFFENSLLKYYLKKGEK